MTSIHSFDLDAYLGRIGYRGAVAPTLDTLTEIQARHPAAITFENLDSLTGRVPSLAPMDVQRKLVTEGRGGYCFEQNLLLR
ncbi:MAG: arylamine N-acetyltransferase, partial [Alphaproteobacteria bacterium]